MEPLSHFTSHRDAALALLNVGKKLNRKSGQFLGQISVEPTPLSEKQNGWLATLLKDNGLPSLIN